MTYNSNLFNLPGDRVMRLGSNSFRAILATLLVVLMSVGVMSAQTTERRGTMSLVEGRKYMVAFPQVWASPTEKPLPQPMLLLISSKVKTKVRVSTPALINDGQQINKEYVVEANKVTRVEIRTSLMMANADPTESETRKGYGIQITSDKPISVTTYQAWQGNGEMARQLPVEGWGKSYYSMNFYQDRYGVESVGKYRPSQILVIADRDQTIVTYTPTVDTQGGIDAPSTRKGASQTVTLEKGETFLIKSKIFPLQNKEWTTDLSGTLIKANKPIGVVSGHTKVGIMRYPDVLPPTGMFATEAHFVRNNVHDAMLPFEMAGTKFVTVPIMYTATRVTGVSGAEFGIDDDRGDVIRVVATEDNTTVRAMRQDGTGLLNKWLLRKKGETALETSLQEATYWESDKPITMGQYGKSYAKILPPGGVINNVDGTKKDDESQGHPTVESGMPMLQYIPSTDRWVEYGVFYAPEGMDNFFNITFKTEDIGKIKVDGRLLNSFSGSMRPLKGTPYSFIRTAIGTGDHVVESMDPSVKWAAWNYGSLDGLAQGRAYGTPIAIDMAIPCDDSLNVKETIVCGDVDGEGMILPENSPCGSIFAVYAESLTNYELVVDENFASGDKKAKFTVKVKDKKQDGTATIRVVSRSGKWVERTYTYVADKIAYDPTSIQFGAIAMNTHVTKQMTVTNLSTDRPVVIKNLRMKSFPQNFRLNPLAFTLAPLETKIVDVIATISTSATIIDTIIAELECFDVNLSEVQVRGEAPQIYVGDQTWTNVPAASAGIRKPVKIVNASKVDLIITGYDQSKMPADNTTGAHFFAPQNLNLPMTLGPNGEHEFTVMYSPNGEAGVVHTENVPFYSNAREVDSIAVLTGNGVLVNIYASVDPWDVRVIDNVQTSQGINSYTKRVLFGNIGDETITFNAPLIRGTDAGSFEIVDMGNVGTFPIQLSKAVTDDKYITVAFKPTELAGRAAERNNYDAQIVFPTSSADPLQAEAKASLNGIAWQPQAKGADLDFPSMDVAAPAQTLKIVISNDHFQNVSNPTSGNTQGTHSVEITDIRIAGANPGGFQILNAPTPTNTWVIAAGEVMELDVRFNPAISGTGTFMSNYEIVTNSGTNGAAVYTPIYKLTAVVTGGTFFVGSADKTEWVHNSTELLVPVWHDQGTARTFDVSQIVNGDQSNFTILEPANGQLTIDKGQTAYIKVQFTPTAVTVMAPGQDMNFLTTSAKATAGDLSFRNTKYEGTIDVTDVVTNEVKQGGVSGNGKFLETTNRVPSAYRLKPNESVDIEVMLDAVPENISVGNLAEIRIRMSYDGVLLRPNGINGDNVKAAIITAGTQTAGWTVKEARKQVGVDNIEVDLVRENGAGSTLAASGTMPMVKVKFDAYLGKGADPVNPFKSPIGIYTYWAGLNRIDDPQDKRYVLIHDIPGEVTIDPNCAGAARLVGLSNQRFAVQPIAPNPVTSNAVINYSIGLDGNTRIVLFNSMGAEILDIVNEYQAKGQYEVSMDLGSLSAGTYYYRVVSGPFTSDAYAITIVK